LAMRRFRTALPLEVDMRLRNPWVLLRFILDGWYVGLRVATAHLLVSVKKRALVEFEA